MRHLPKLLTFFVLTVFAVPAFYLLMEKVVGDAIPAAYADVPAPPPGGDGAPPPDGGGCGCDSGSTGSSGSCCAG